jgi:hypothetical protein
MEDESRTGTQSVEQYGKAHDARVIVADSNPYSSEQGPYPRRWRESNSDTNFRTIWQPLRMMTVKISTRHDAPNRIELWLHA